MLPERDSDENGFHSCGATREIGEADRVSAYIYMLAVTNIDGATRRKTSYMFLGD